MLVAVYGSLRQGFGNHQRFLSHLKPLGLDLIEGWDMYSLGAFPAIVGGSGAVVVEVYDVDDNTLRMLDGLEGFPHFYNRSQVSTEYGEAWVYHFNEDWSGRANYHHKVESGDWRDYKGGGY
jgi:gamma-glutamylcyclotransferase (GGCT)/AIG2-like uncharacterized protein YtfP